MNSKNFLCGSFLLVFLIVSPISALADEVAAVSADQAAPVSLCGSLKRETRWGPPGFGETPKVDAKRLVWFVELRRPTVFRHKGDNGKNVEETLKAVQISLASNAFDHQLHRSQGRPVVITGPVWSASSEGDMTPVVIEMAAIASMGKSTVCTN